MTEAIESPRVDVAPCFPTNPGIFSLGHRKEHVLAHEIGAGSKCRNCDCPGLDLHFWRKICKECGCRMDEHDVQLPNQYDHGQIIIGRLFGAKEYFEKEFQKRDERRGSQMSNSISGTPSKQASPVLSRSIPTAVYNYKMSSEKENKPSVEYTWAPVPDKILVEKYMNALPVEERPIVGTVGEETRKSRLQYQLPLYDCNVEDSRFTNENDKKALANFVENVKKNIIGVGTVFEVDNKPPMMQAVEVEDDENPEETMKRAMKHLSLHPPVTECHKCHEFFKKGEAGIKTDHGKSHDAWHPNCFRCATCDQLLVDIIYFYHDEKYYCGRHYADKIYPRCAGCDELIFANEYTWAEEKAWHVDHFACYKCDLKLGGHRYMTKDEQPYCIPCYMEKFAKTCEVCQKKIEPDEKRLNYKEYHWHASSDCFKCAACKTDLMGHKFILKHPNLFCSSSCRTNFAQPAQS